MKNTRTTDVLVIGSGLAGENRFEVITTDEDVFGCLGLMACQAVCPKNLPLLEVYPYLRGKMLTNLGLPRGGRVSLNAQGCSCPRVTPRTEIAFSPAVFYPSPFPLASFALDCSRFHKHSVEA